MMFCSLKELITESDVEQKLLWPLLTTSVPNGAGLLAADILTKLSIRRLEIGKGTGKKLYYPDYMVVLAGLPVLVVEAKAPRESVEQGLTEARLYGTELNALFPSGINPCTRVVACNGSELQSAPVDTADPDIKLKHSDISGGSTLFAELIDLCCRAALQAHADDIRKRFRKPQYRRAVTFVGGPAFQNEELAPNTFGATIVGDYGHVFNPRTRAERALIARDAYVPSLRRQRYIEPIDRLIRSAVMPATAQLPTLEDTSLPSELSAALSERRNLENQVLLLVGSVGSGKSTFVDYVSVVALPEELRRRTVWARINLNDAPLSADVAYTWIARAITSELKAAIPDEDVNDLETLEKIFRPELNMIRRGALKLLDPNSTEYKTRLADELLKLQRDDIGFAKDLARYMCAGPGKLLVIVLDNCDKRTRDEQLTMFSADQTGTIHRFLRAVANGRDIPQYDSDLESAIGVSDRRHADPLHGGRNGAGPAASSCPPIRRCDRRCKRRVGTGPGGGAGAFIHLWQRRDPISARLAGCGIRHDVDPGPSAKSGVFLPFHFPAGPG